MPDSEVLNLIVRRHHTRVSAAPRARSSTVSEPDQLILCYKSRPLLVNSRVFRGSDVDINHPRAVS